MAKKPRWVEVEWDDAWSDDKRVFGDSDYYEQSYSQFSAGFLKSMKGGRIVVCETWAAKGIDDEGASFKQCISIPRKMVKKITWLRGYDD